MSKLDRSLAFALLALSAISMGFGVLATQEAYSTATTAIVTLAGLYLAQRGHAHQIYRAPKETDDAQR